MPPLRSPEHHSSRAPSWLLVAAVGAAVASASALAFESPLVEGDPLFSLIWGTQLANGDLTTFAFGPTPHPLTVGAAAITSVLGSYGSYAATYALFGPLSLGALSAAVFAVARRFVSPLAGVLAVLVLITRPPILGWAATARYDIAFGALVVGALALELSRPRRGIAPLALLAIAGLIRPEAWLMSAAYWYWALRGADRGGRLAGAALVLLAPVLWSGMDLAVTGDPLWSLHVTDDASEQLYGRFTPLENLEEGGRNLVTIAGPITLLLAPIALLRRNPPTIARLRPLLLLLAMTVGVFLALVATGMASSERYLLVPACLIAVLAAIAASPQGLNRNGVAIAAAVLLLIQVLARVDSAFSVRDELRPAVERNGEVRDLLARTEVSRPVQRCPRVALPGRIVPAWAYFSGRPLQRWTFDDHGRSAPDIYIAPSPTTAAELLTRQRFDSDAGFTVPSALVPGPASRSWRVYFARGPACASALEPFGLP